MTNIDDCMFLKLKVLPLLSTAVLCERSPCPSSPDYPGNSGDGCRSRDSSTQTGKHRPPGQSKRKTTWRNSFCGLDICSNTHVLQVSLPYFKWQKNLREGFGANVSYSFALLLIMIHILKSIVNVREAYFYYFLSSK